MNDSASGFNIVTQYSHIWNVMDRPGRRGSCYNMVDRASGQTRSPTDPRADRSSIIDTGVSGTDEHMAFILTTSPQAIIANNVLYRIGSGGLANAGPTPGTPANVLNNNIVAFARRAMFEEGPRPEELQQHAQAKVTHNLFYFDLDDTSGFHAVSGCADSCGMPYRQFQGFQGNLYWRTDGGFANYPNAFFVMNTTPPPGQASACLSYTEPTDFTYLTFAQWQNSTPRVNGQLLTVNEDTQGTAKVDPGFGSSGQPSDFLLAGNPVSGFDYTQTNDTINNAGRQDPQIMPPTVPDTFPTYYYSNF